MLVKFLTEPSKKDCTTQMQDKNNTEIQEKLFRRRKRQNILRPP
jgi:hypothetical protein